MVRGGRSAWRVLLPGCQDPTLLTARTSQSPRERDINQDLCSAARVPTAICPGYIAFLKFFQLYPAAKKRHETSTASPLRSRDYVSDFCKLYHLSTEECKALFKSFELIGTSPATAPLVARDETAIAAGVERRDLDQDLCRASFVPASLCSLYINFLKIYHIYPGSATKRDLVTTASPLESRDLHQDLCKAAFVPPFLCSSYISLLKIYHIYPGSSTGTTTKRDELTSALEPRTLDQDICRIALVPSFLCPLYIILLKINRIYPALESRSATPTPLDVAASLIPISARDAGQDICAQYSVPALLCPAIIAFFNKFGNIGGGGGLGGGLLARRDLAAEIPELIQYCHTLSPLPTLCDIVIREVEQNNDGDRKVDVDEIRNAIVGFLGMLGVDGTAGPVLLDPVTFVAREKRDVVASMGAGVEKRGITIDAGITLGSALTFGVHGGEDGIVVAKEK